MTTARTTGSDTERIRSNRRAGYLAFAWVVIFIAWHVVWYVTGLAFPTPTHFHGARLVVYWTADILMDVMWVVGVALPLALVQSWGRRLPRWSRQSAAWVATGVLTLRGASGVLDDLLRAVGHSGGLTGLTAAETWGTDHVTTWMQVAGLSTDLLFTIGAVVFGCAAIAHRRLCSVNP